MNNKKCVFFKCLMVICLFSNECVYASVCDSIIYYVSASAEKKGDGSFKKPYSGLENAFKQVRSIREKQKDCFIKIYLRGGEYYFNQTFVLEGSLFDNLTLSAYPGEKVVFTGGKQISLSKIKSVMLNRNRVQCVDLKECGIDGYGKIRNVGFLRPFEKSWMEVFVNGKPLHLCRWPNQGTVPVGTVLDAGSLPFEKDYADRGGVFHFDSARISSWKQTDDMWIAGYFRHGYADDMVQIAHIDTIAKTIQTESATFWGYGSGAPWNRFYALNIIEELDALGEYMIDRKQGKLYFITDEPITDLSVSILEKPFLDMYQVENVNIEGILFQYSRFTAVTMAKTHRVRVSDCVFRNMGSLAISVGLGIEPFDVQVHDSTGMLKRGIVGALQQHIYANTNANLEGGTGNGIVRCRFYNLGSGAIVLNGGDREKLVPANNYIDSCLFHDNNRVEKSYRPNVYITGVGNKLMNSEIYNTPSMAVMMYGNDHLIELNNIHHACMEVDDNGAFYYGRNPSECGNIVRKNVFANIPSAYSCCAVYIDDGAGGLLIEDNVFYKAGKYAILMGGGSDNRILNNLFLNTDMAIHADNRLQNWAKHIIKKGDLFDQRLDAVNAFGELYLKRYPYLKYYRELNGEPQRNIFIHNTLRAVCTLSDNPQFLIIDKNTIE